MVGALPYIYILAQMSSNGSRKPSQDSGEKKLISYDNPIVNQKGNWELRWLSATPHQGFDGGSQAA